LRLDESVLDLICEGIGVPASFYVLSSKLYGGHGSFLLLWADSGNTNG
jgi:hypothetical protein